MANVEIGRLSLTIENASGHEHRIRPIASRAASIFAARLDERLGKPEHQPRSAHIGSLTASPLHFDLRVMSNEQAASAISSAWLETLALKLWR
jgi:hypothetical protein